LYLALTSTTICTSLTDSEDWAVSRSLQRSRGTSISSDKSTSTNKSSSRLTSSGISSSMMKQTQRRQRLKNYRMCRVRSLESSSTISSPKISREWGMDQEASPRQLQMHLKLKMMSRPLERKRRFMLLTTIHTSLSKER
jgi:hypothetical protein